MKAYYEKKIGEVSSELNYLIDNAKLNYKEHTKIRKLSE